MRKLLSLLFCGLTILGFSQTTNQSDLKDLVASIKSIVSKSNTPAAAVSIVKGDSILLASGFGIRNLETLDEANEQTLFRIGSISKMFVALSVLKLQEENKISLKDRLRDIAPEIEYENPWEATNPILIEHLLEHTTGWDDIHLSEYAHNESNPILLKDALDFHPHSRTSRWVPGTRYAYCNSGPPVAAYIVQKITGQNFEEYVQEKFFDPLGMKTATYFQNDNYIKNGVTLYKSNQPQLYWNIIMRASGSINASALDMAKLVKFFIQGASIDSVQIISNASLHRMETPKSTIGNDEGVEVGYGLNNYSSSFNDFPFQGHNGGVNGGSSELAYNRALDIGFGVMINSANSDTRTQISEAIVKYFTKDLTIPKNEFEPKATNAFDGYYYIINPRRQQSYFTSRLFNIKKIWSDDSLIYLADYPVGKPSVFYPASENQAYNSNGKIALAIVNDPLKGNVVTSGWGVYAPMPWTAVWSFWSFIAIWVIGLLTSGVWILVTIIRLLIGSEKPSAIHLIQSGQVTIAVCLILFFGFLAYGSQNPFEMLGEPTGISRTIYFTSLLIGITSFISIGISAFYFKKVKRTFTFWFFTSLSFMSFLATLYLLNHGVIGLKTWG